MKMGTYFASQLNKGCRQFVEVTLFGCDSVTAIGVGANHKVMELRCGDNAKVVNVSSGSLDSVDNGFAQDRTTLSGRRMHS